MWFIIAFNLFSCFYLLFCDWYSWSSNEILLKMKKSEDSSHNSAFQFNLHDVYGHYLHAVMRVFTRQMICLNISQLIYNKSVHLIATCSWDESQLSDRFVWFLSVSMFKLIRQSNCFWLVIVYQKVINSFTQIGLVSVTNFNLN